MTYLELAHRIAEINKKILRISEYTKMTDVNRGENFLLSYLVSNDGEATPIELSKALNVSTARISVLLNKMERKNLVKRQSHPDNSRNVIVKLLPEGKKISDEHARLFNQGVISFFETLGEEKATMYVELQNELAEFMMKKHKGDNNNE